MRDLPKGLPPIVRDALTRAAREIVDAADRKAEAYSAYQQHIWWARQAPAIPPTAEASSLFDWALALRRDLLAPFGGEMRDLIADLPPLALVSHEIALPEVDRGIPAGRLKTTLELDFDEERFLNHHDWFDGLRVTGGGTLNTEVAIRTSVHPEMLRQIHALVAEGQIWDRVVHGFGEMVKAFKDR
ncbi:MAG TPA: hypothetical protein VL283_00715 [Candidatus Baltobacteraceae bacterium]|nr:hypothetical protein [Candidatus Baltobacteraceae bacterium]